MIYENTELHNVVELVSCGRGLRLQRVPEAVRTCLNQGAQYRVLQPDNCELRFVSESDREVSVTLSSEGETDVALFYGMFDSQVRHRIGREPTTITIGLPSLRLQDLDRKWWGSLPFSPQVRRLVFGGPRREPVMLHTVEGGDIRPPRAEELPSLRCLSYGTSITHGFFCEAPGLSYTGRTARLLGADLLNLGVAGACHCEPEFADHIAERSDWDVATLSLSVNMQGFALDEFRSRVEYMVNTVAGADTSRPVGCITLFPYYRDFGLSYAEETY
ncbi:MAG: SGNH/GDSL hydrolase family protein, partial [bacterium]